MIFPSRAATLLDHIWEPAPGCLASRRELGRFGGVVLEPSGEDSGRSPPPPPPTHPAGSPSLQLPLLVGCLATAALICSYPEQTAWR